MKPCDQQNYLNTYYCILDQMIKQMLEVQLSNSISYNFIVMMIPHHQAAIEMCANVLKYTKNETLQDIAFQIIRQQTQSIKNMQIILENCQCYTNENSEICQYNQKMDKIIYRMFTKMNDAKVTGCISADFIEEMIPHHQGAIEMSSETLEYMICPQLKPILENIIRLQKQGIEQMTLLLQQIDKI